MATGKRGPVGSEDFSFHDPSAGTTTQTFNRTTSTGGSVARTKMSAAKLPILDAPTVAGALTPFETLADTQAAKNVETCLAEVRKNMAFSKNFETYGGLAGTGISSADATRNTQVFNQIITDIQASGRRNGIFFPGGRYEFKYIAGAGHLNVPIMSNLSMQGPNIGCALAPHSTSADTAPLFDLVDTPGFVMTNLTLDCTGVTLQGILSMTCTTVAINDVLFDRVFTIGGLGSAIFLSGSATFQGIRYTVRDCNLSGLSGAGLTVLGWGAGRVHRNVFAGSLNIGIAITAGTGANMAETEVIGNYMFGNEAYIGFTRSGTFSGSLHKGFTIRDNRISNGDILLNGINEVECSSNFIYNGGILLQVDASMASSFNMRLLNNQINGGLFAATYSGNKHGVYVLGAGNSMEGLEIAGGRIRSASHHGIKIQMETGTCRYGSIHDVLINNPNRAANNSSGIFLDDGAAKSTMYMNIHHNQIITDTNTRPDYGIKEAGLVSSKTNYVNNNITRGYIIEDVTLLAPGSTESGNFDCGAPLAP